MPTADSADPGQTAQCFMLAIEGIPEEFVAEAARRYIQGRVLRKSHTFLPAAPEFAIEARKCWTEAQCAALPPKALPAPERIISPEERAEVERRMNELLGKLKASEPSAPRRHSMTLEEELLMGKDAFIPVSPRLQESLKKLTANDERAA